MYRSSRGFILKDTVVLILAGTLLMSVTLTLFRSAWISDTRLRTTMRNINDFRVVSERLKYDLNKTMKSFRIVDDRTAEFEFYHSDGRTLSLKRYRLHFNGYELLYLTGDNQMKLSNKVQDISLVMDGNILTIVFQYGEESYRRSYSILLEE